MPRGFIVERREVNGTYRSLHKGLTKPHVRTFFDNRRLPGRMYEYRLVAKLSNGVYAFPAGTMRPTQPFFALEPVVKTIAGMVVNRDKEVIAGAEVYARRIDGRGWNSTLTEEDGSYLLGVGSGSIQVSVRSPRGQKAYWVYMDKPARYKFPHDGVEEQRQHNFIVEKTTSLVNGRVIKPDGTNDWGDEAKLINVVFESSKGLRGASTLESDGSFEIPLMHGHYEASIWLSSALNDYNRPKVQHLRVRKGTSTLPDIVLTSRNATITGNVTGADGSALRNITVQAWNNRGERASAITDENGSYSLKVNAGKWEVLVEPPTSFYDNQETATFIEEPARRIKIRDGASKVLDFKMSEIVAYLEGDIIDGSGELAEDVEAWVYVRRKGSSKFDCIGEEEVDDTSAFYVDLPSGTFLLGLWVDPDSGYTAGPEIEITVDSQGGISSVTGASIEFLSLNVVENDAVVNGTITIDGETLVDISGEVYAINGDGMGGFYNAPINEDGTYSLTLPAGDWMIDYDLEIEDDSATIPQQPSTPAAITAISSQTIIKNFDIVPLSATISGEIHDADGTVLEDTSIFVWIRRDASDSAEGFWVEEEVEDGYFEINVESGHIYMIGAYLTPDLRADGYIEPSLQIIDLTEVDQVEANIDLMQVVASSSIAGIVSNVDGKPLEDAFIYAWSDDGKVASEARTGADGTYSLEVQGGVVWNVGADFIEIDDDTGTETVFLTETELRVDLRLAANAVDQNIVLTKAPFNIPSGRMETFNPSDDFVLVLEDGTELRIPAGAVPVDDSVLEVTLVVQPFADGLSKSVNDQPLNYGYSFELYYTDGQAITEDFNEPIIIGVPYDENDLNRLGIDIGEVSLSFFSATRNAWVAARISTVDRQSKKIFAQMDHFSSWTPSGPPGDTTPPILNLIGESSLTHEAATAYNDAGASASDDVDGDITASIQVFNPVDITELGSYEVVYAVSDSSGNAANQLTRIVSVVDTTAPSIVLTGEPVLTIEAGSGYTDAGATGFDTLEGDLTDDVEAASDVDAYKPGSYSVTFNLSDAAGNDATEIVRTVNIVDTTEPKLTLNGDPDIIHEASTNYTDPGATATDLVDGVLSANIQVTNFVDVSKVGNYTVTYTVTDSAGNDASLARNVTVVDTTSPTITLTGDSTISLEINSDFSDPGAIATDTHDGDLNVSIADGGLDTTTEGSYILTYTATDTAGNAASVKRTVNVNWSVPVIVKESDVTDLGSGYYASTWFGPSFPEDINWLYSPVLGWLYVVGNDTGSLWIYDQAKGWFWTNKDTYPYIYVESSSTWFYVWMGSAESRWLWNSSIESWESE